MLFSILLVILWVLLSSGSLLYMLLTRGKSLHPFGCGLSVFFGWGVAGVMVSRSILYPLITGIYIGVLVGTALGVAQVIGKWILGYSDKKVPDADLTSEMNSSPQE
jgi:hypothetical protein